MEASMEKLKGTSVKGIFCIIKVVVQGEPQAVGLLVFIPMDMLWDKEEVLLYVVPNVGRKD